MFEGLLQPLHLLVILVVAMLGPLGGQNVHKMVKFREASNFAKPRQTRAKARDYELGKTFRHTRSRGL